MTLQPGPTPLSPSRMIARITIGTFVGGGVGLILGLVLYAAGAVGNPFWLMSAGLMAGVLLTATWNVTRAKGAAQPSRRSQRPPFNRFQRSRGR